VVNAAVPLGIGLATPKTTSGAAKAATVTVCADGFARLNSAFHGDSGTTDPIDLSGLNAIKTLFIRSPVIPVADAPGSPPTKTL